jgi:molecular chaperone DnaJ
MALRIPGHGMPAAKSGGNPGDLFVVVRTLPDRRFERAGSNLWRKEKVEVADAVLGANRDVPTLDGSVSLKIRPGTQPDSVLRLRGKGLPEFGSNVRGDLFVRVEVHIPENVSAKERELYEKLRRLAK